MVNEVAFDTIIRAEGEAGAIRSHHRNLRLQLAREWRGHPADRIPESLHLSCQLLVRFRAVHLETTSGCYWHGHAYEGRPRLHHCSGQTEKDENWTYFFQVPGMVRVHISLLVQHREQLSQRRRATLVRNGVKDVGDLATDYFARHIGESAPRQHG